MIRVQKSGKWGWINLQGEEVISCRFDAVTPFYMGRARVIVAGYWEETFINNKGEAIFGQYDH